MRRYSKPILALAFLHLSRILQARDVEFAVGVALSNFDRISAMIQKARVSPLMVSRLGSYIFIFSDIQQAGELPGNEIYRGLLHKMIRSASNPQVLSNIQLLGIMQHPLRETAPDLSTTMAEDCLPPASDNIVKYFRAITSAQIRLNPTMYRRGFAIYDDSMFPDVVCQLQVEVCGVEAGTSLLWWYCSP